MFVELKRAFPKEIGKMYNDNPELLESVFQKAREKEKEVIIDAWLDDRFPLDKSGHRNVQNNTTTKHTEVTNETRNQSRG